MIMLPAPTTLTQLIENNLPQKRVLQIMQHLVAQDMLADRTATEDPYEFAGFIRKVLLSGQKDDIEQCVNLLRPLCEAFPTTIGFFNGYIAEHINEFLTSDLALAVLLTKPTNAIIASKNPLLIDDFQPRPIRPDFSDITAREIENLAQQGTPSDRYIIALKLHTFAYLAPSHAQTWWRIGQILVQDTDQKIAETALYRLPNIVLADLRLELSALNLARNSTVMAVRGAPTVFDSIAKLVVQSERDEPSPHFNKYAAQHKELLIRPSDEMTEATNLRNKL